MRRLRSKDVVLILLGDRAFSAKLSFACGGDPQLINDLLGLYPRVVETGRGVDQVVCISLFLVLRHLSGDTHFGLIRAQIIA